METRPKIAPPVDGRQQPETTALLSNLWGRENKKLAAFVKQRT
jgi:hypothetical protein